MFTGIVEKIGRVAGITPAPRRAPDGSEAYVLDVRLGELLDDLQPGASVAINGVCLTLTERRGDVGRFDVIPETWQNTTLRRLVIDQPVNVERSLRVGDRLDGHFVQGHVDGVGRVERIERAGGEWKLWIAADATLMPYIVRKGAVALDGTSLTVVDVRTGGFSVALIPTTRDRTVLGRRQPGDWVNIETDLIARVVISHLAQATSDGAAGGSTGAITFESLREGGYL